MRVLVVEFIIKPEHVTAFHAAIVSNANASVTQERGWRQFDVCVDPARPGRFVLYALYDDDAAVQAHLASEHFRAMDALTAGWFESRTVMRLDRAAP